MNRHFRLKPLAFALAAALPAPAFALPTAPTVAAGSASFATSGRTLSVTNSSGAIINWQGFSIGVGETVKFIQPSAASQVLNRVTGGNPSQILGSLQSNGRVFLINPNGIAFGKDAQVNVAGLVVSTLQMSDADFRAGKLRFTDTPGAGSISNEGTIQTQKGGQVILVAPQIENSGLIHSPEGQILLAAGRSVTISDLNQPEIEIQITNPEQKAVNIGTLIGRQISLYGGVVNNSGTIEATTAEVGKDGRIRLRARYDVENTGTLKANGPAGGSIEIQAEEGTARVAGLVEARALTPEQLVQQQQAIAQRVQEATAAQPAAALSATIDIVPPAPDAASSAESGAIDAAAPATAYASDSGTVASALPQLYGTSSTDQTILTQPTGPLDPLGPQPASPGDPLLPNRQQGQGGSIRVLGRSVRIDEGAVLDASGPLGGGEILVGGDYQGSNAAIQNAEFTYLARGAILRADATDEGQGGRIIVWADDTTRAWGSISARGGGQGGDGGFIEVSGKRFLDFDAAIDTRAPHGQNGTLLLDPANLTIGTVANVNGDGATGDDVAGNIAAGDHAGANSFITATQVATLLNTTNLSLAASNDITVSSAIAKTGATDTTLTLAAGNNININASITSSASRLNMVLNPNSDNVGGGAVVIGTGTTLNANGGSIDASGKSINLGSGTLANATLFAASLASSSGKLSNITIGSNLATSGGALFIQNGLTLADGVNFNIGGTWLYFNTANQSVTTPGAATIQMAGGGLYVYAANSTLTLGSGLTVQGYGRVASAYSDGAIVNNGVINASTAGQTLTVDPASFTNAGTVQSTAGTLNLSPTTFNQNGSLLASGGTLTVNPTNAWSNAAGSIGISAGTFNLGGTTTLANLQAGTFSRTGGTLNLTGTLDLGGSTIGIDSGGTFGTGGLSTLSGTLRNGTITGTTLTTSSGKLSNITIGSNLATSGGALFIQNGLTLADGVNFNIGGTWLYFNTANQSVTTPGAATIQMAGGGLYVYAANSTLTLGSGLTVQGYGRVASAYSDGAIVNNGTILNNTANALTISPAIFTNNGIIATASTGAIHIAPQGNTTSWTNAGLIEIGANSTVSTQSRNMVNNGTLRGSGTLDVGYTSSGSPVVYTLRTLTNNGTLDPGVGAGGTGTLTIRGNLVQGAGGTLHIDLGGTAAGQYDRLAVVGIAQKAATAQLGGTLEIVEGTNDFYASMGDAFPNLVTANGGLSGSFASVIIPADVSFTINQAGTVGITGTTQSLTYWATDSDGDWDTAANWTRGVPTAGKDTIVSRAGNPVITIDSAAATPHSLVLDEDLRLAAGGTFTLPTTLTSYDHTLTLAGGTLTNPNVLTLGGPLLLESGSIVGAGSITLAGSGTATKTTSGTATIGQAFNNGTSVTVAAGLLNLSGGGSHTGTFSVASGATLDFAGGTHQFGDGSHFAGAGTFAHGGGTLQLTGSGSGLTLDAGASLDLAAMAFTGSGRLTNNGTVTGTNASFGGTLVNNATASLTSGTLAGGFINNDGATLNVSGNLVVGGATATIAGGTINLNAGATLTKNTGTLDWSGGTIDGSGTLAFTGGGLIAFSGSGDRVMSSPNLNFSFTDLNLPAGSLTLQQGTLTFNTTGSNVTTLPAGTTLNLQGGTLNNNGPLSIGGTFNISGGTYAGSGSLLMAGGTLNRSGGDWTSSGTMTNTGTLNLGAGTYSSPIVNQGTMSASGATLNAPFTNEGTFSLTGGTTTFAAGFTQTSGTTTLNGGNAAGNMAINGGSLLGSGTIYGDLYVGAGTLSPGFSPGGLTITGNLTLSPLSTTLIEVGGLSAGSQFDVINVGGLATLDGTLNVVSWGGYTPASTDAFDFMTFGSSTGSFATANLPAAWGGSLAYYPGYIQLAMGGVVPPLPPPSSIPISIDADALPAAETRESLELLALLDEQVDSGYPLSMPAAEDEERLAPQQCQ